MSDEIRIERGVPTDEELAAIVGVLLLRAPAPVPEEPPRSRWAASARPAYTRRDAGWRAFRR
jgi:hypothetical protein